ncbi:hypothetical protein, partial [Maribacter luteus]|uniref:hypothetical protein n=1 Tax=Maribacter luteus TaxID=2594478 RepID=UPI002490AB8A
TPIIIFLAFFSAAFGIFYYLVLKGLFKLPLKPAWPLFVIPPVVVILTAVYDAGYTPFVCLVNFPMLLLLMIIGGIYKSIREKESLLQILIFVLGIPVIILTWPWGIFLLFVRAIFLDIVKPSDKNEFYELQRVLPTSKIRSMAMGLVEITGRASMIEPVISRIKKEPCIGYLYKIDAISKDKDGKKSYTNISTETVCNDFLLNDDTGSVTVSGTDISFIDLPESPHSYESNNKRYQLFLLVENMSVLLIGKAVNKNQKIRLEKDDGKNIFALSTTEKVFKWNLYRPLRKSFIRHFILLLALVTLIFMMDLKIEGDSILISISSVYESFNLSEIFNFNF